MCVRVLTVVTKKENQPKDMHTCRPIDYVNSATQTKIARQTGLRLAPIVCCCANVNQNVLTIGYSIIKDSVCQTLGKARMTAGFAYLEQLA